MKAVLAAALISCLPSVVQAQGDDFNWVDLTGVYVSAFGGYVGQDGPSVRGHSNIPQTAEYPVAVRHGGFAGGTIGYAFPSSVSLFGHRNLRIEASFAQSWFAQDRAESVGGRITSLDGTMSTSQAVVPAFSIHDREVQDGSIALKGQMAWAPNHSVAHALELFVRTSEDRTYSQCCTGPIGWRSADVDSLYYGAMLALQPEIRIADGVALIGDFGVGAYIVEADASLAVETSFIPATSLALGDDAIGFRGRAMGGVKFALASGLTATLFGGLDYWSRAPYANMPVVNFTPAFSSHVSFADLVELKGGLRLTYAPGAAAN